MIVDCLVSQEGKPVKQGRFQMRTRKLYVLAITLSAALAQAQEPQKAATYPHRLTGEELKAHFKETWSASGATSKARPIAFFNNSDGTFRIRSLDTSRAPDGFGKREITDKDQVCLNVQTTSWRGIAGCYRLVENEPRAFSLVKGSYRIDYRR